MWVELEGFFKFCRCLGDVTFSPQSHSQLVVRKREVGSQLQGGTELLDRTGYISLLKWLSGHFQ